MWPILYFVPLWPKLILCLCGNRIEKRPFWKPPTMQKNTLADSSWAPISTLEYHIPLHVLMCAHATGLQAGVELNFKTLIKSVWSIYLSVRLWYDTRSTTSLDWTVFMAMHACPFVYNNELECHACMLLKTPQVVQRCEFLCSQLYGYKELILQPSESIVE